MELSFHSIPTNTTIGTSTITNINTSASNVKKKSSKPITTPLGASLWIFFFK